MSKSTVLAAFCFLFHGFFLSCSGYFLPQQWRIRAAPVQQSDSDFMGDIARERVTIKSLEKLSPDEKKSNKFSAPSNFERDELLRILSEINEKNVSWFQLTLFAQKRYAKSVMCILDSPSALDIVSSTSSSGAFSLGTAAEGLWRVTLSNEDIYKSWTKGMQIYFNIRNILPSVPNFAADKSIDEGNRKTSGEGTFEQIIELPLSPGLVPNRIRQVGTLTQNKVDGSLEYSFEKTIVSWLGREWQLPFGGDSSPSGCLGVSYMDGKVWLDVRDLSGGTTRNSAAASKFTALTYISGPKQEKDWIGS